MVNSVESVGHFYINHMMEKLFFNERRRLNKIVDQIHEANQEALNKNLDGYIYSGQFYRHSSSATGGGLRESLHLSLWPQMEIYLKDKEKIDNDEQIIRQVIFRQFQHCMHIHEMRSAVPECLADTLPPELAQLERKFEPTFFINTQRDLKQYNQALPLIEFYSTARLIY